MSRLKPILDNIEADTVINDFNKSIFYIKKRPNEIIQETSFINKIKKDENLSINRQDAVAITSSSNDQCQLLQYSMSLGSGNDTLTRANIIEEVYNNQEKKIEYANISRTHSLTSIASSCASKTHIDNIIGVSPSPSIVSSSTASISAKSIESTTSSARALKRKKNKPSSCSESPKKKTNNIKNKLEFYSKITNIGLSGVRMIETMSLNSKVYWLRLDGYTDSIEKEKETISELLTEIDPLDLFADVIVSPHVKLLLIFTVPLVITIFRNLSRHSIETKMGIDKRQQTTTPKSDNIFKQAKQMSNSEYTIEPNSTINVNLDNITSNKNYNTRSSIQNHEDRFQDTNNSRIDNELDTYIRRQSNNNGNSSDSNASSASSDRAKSNMPIFHQMTSPASPKLISRSSSTNIYHTNNNTNNNLNSNSTNNLNNNLNSNSTNNLNNNLNSNSTNTFNFDRLARNNDRPRTTLRTNKSNEPFRMFKTNKSINGFDNRMEEY
jgi:hypothetical protein